MKGNLYASGFTARGIKREWDRTSVSNADAEQLIRRHFALKPEIRVTDAIAWWRDDGSLAVLTADLSSGKTIDFRQNKRGRWSIGFTVRHRAHPVTDIVERDSG